MADRLSAWLLAFTVGVVVTAAALLFLLKDSLPFKQNISEFEELFSPPKLIVADISFDPGAEFTVEPVSSALVKGLQDNHGAAFDGIAGRNVKVQSLTAAPNEILPANLSRVEADILVDSHARSGEMLIYGWRRNGVTWLGFLPRNAMMRAGLQFYNPQGRVIGLPAGLDTDNRGSFVAAFALAQSGLARKDGVSREELDGLIATRVRARQVLQDPRFDHDAELLRAYGTISLAIDVLETRFDKRFSDSIYLHDAWYAYQSALGACERARCADDRVAQIYNDLGNVLVALGDLEQIKTRPGEKSRYVDAIDAFQRARALWAHGGSDNPPSALAANNLGVASLKLARLLNDQSLMRNAQADFDTALAVWQNLTDAARHHCAWAMTQGNKSKLCADGSQCQLEALATAQTMAKAGHCVLERE